VVGGLVEHQEVRRLEQHLGQDEARLLAADSTRQGFSTSSPENPNAPASVRSEPSDAPGELRLERAEHRALRESSSMACWAK
jgi:hypothetical protein